LEPCEVQGKSSADLVSRGADTIILKHSSLWWSGPTWLREEETSWPKCEHIREVGIEKKQVNPLQGVNLVSQPRDEEIVTKFSSWIKLQRIIAYCLRFIHNCRRKSVPYRGALSLHELNEATVWCARQAQNGGFNKEKNDLLNKGLISNKSSLLSLNPF